MKKVINGKMYNTDTATEVGCFRSAGSWSDFDHYEETLFRKRTGEYFLFGEGGAMTNYARRSGDGYACGEEILPQSWSSAREWAERNMDADAYEQEFGAVAEDDSKITIGISISATAAETAKREAAKLGTSVSAYIESLILA